MSGIHIAFAKLKKEVGRLQGFVERLQGFVDILQEQSGMRLQRLREHGISDPVWEQEYNTDEYTGEMKE
jgi:hypothetical protein|tara:strand:+ start:379 stop:585 length:207 start_codon:yes stop_codon:yes gene_type:complete